MGVLGCTESAIVQVTPDAERRAAIADARLFKSVVTALFTQRRKTAAKALGSLPRRKLSKQQVAAALEAAGIALDARSDALPVAQILALANALAGAR